MHNELTEQLQKEVEGLGLAESLAFVAERFPQKAVFSTSFGMEDQVITDAIFRAKSDIKVFTLDTGRLFNETYEVYSRTVARYKFPITPFYPNQDEIQEFVKTKGINSFYESVENRKECCRIRKIEPLKKALAGAELWITGIRADQSENRKGFNLFEYDASFNLIKFNPILLWTEDDVREYIKKNSVPYNFMHDKGFVSIGCAPCTRAIEPGEDPRAGRWWWEESKKECGLHSS
ncbi:phosphoadenylyl-sulfate reductase [Solitalea canadensis]|uniref:Adenosine 5'-phosphosulfate reductase n=1 Tax=Solitalea canadensis (strain ATCC 29591 / DSM 3403 / JCM 21819 / LMG 8368 / NBRC 15130 / NCIMB 12057 / USAM 9D) TaxID=929556 RepID=H8KUG6_SOLCM|nr:phosphoadenylyl-sulfate reductase [Solitalea canadensis]AFD07331.1 thioredoxin-dependent phosophoadenylyl-sulfate reductase [Solitalea canadensis DSM 3403]